MFLDANYVAAIIKLRGYQDTYLYIARLLDPRVLAQLNATREGVAQYADLEARRVGVQIAFGLMYTVISLIVLLSAVWIGLNFANYLVAPIRRLIGAAQVVATGNLYVQVPTRRSEGDLAQLGETFNKMTQELRTQRDDIVRARDLIDSRRRFTEAVLASASAGVIGVDAEGRISILNRSAERLIGCSETEALGRLLTEIVPEIAEIFATARVGVQRLVQGQVTINRNGKERNVSVRVTSEQSGAAEYEYGYVVTLDDITELVTAQRTSAWADVARRIAHEIKNPLTPIQLSAERLRRKYLPGIKEDTTVFAQCVDTIVRQVDDIKRMVDEFSRFARMPKPVMETDNVADTVRQVVFLQRVGNADIDIDVEIAGRSDAGAVRPPPDLARPDQHHQERHRGGRSRAAGRTRARAHPRFRRARRRRHRHRRGRQRHWAAEGKPQPAARAVRDDAGKRERDWGSRSSAGSSRTTAAGSNSATRQRNIPGSGARGCACASRQ